MSNDQYCSLSICTDGEPTAMDVETCECPPVSVTKGIKHRLTTIPLSYSIGIPFGWLLFGTIQYFVCVVILGDSLLDPWYFTCVWVLEIICLFPITMIIAIINCSYVQLDILEYCEDITWTYFTFLQIQGLIIILLLLPISNFFKYAIGDFSKPINFFIYWMMFVFPHTMILCFATFVDRSKMCRMVPEIHTLSLK